MRFVPDSLAFAIYYTVIWQHKGLKHKPKNQSSRSLAFTCLTHHGIAARLACDYGSQSADMFAVIIIAFLRNHVSELGIAKI